MRRQRFIDLVALYVGGVIVSTIFQNRPHTHPATPASPRLTELSCSIDRGDVFHLRRSPSPTARRRDIAGIWVLKGPCLGYGQVPPPFSLALILPNSTSELSLDCQMCVAQIGIPRRRPGNPVDRQRTGSRSSDECAQVCFAAAPVDRRGNRGVHCR
jgi:hypothetical protein